MFYSLGTIKKKSHTPLLSFPSCNPSAESRAASAAAGSAPAGDQSSPGAGRCAPGNPNLNPEGRSSAVLPVHTEHGHVKHNTSC